MTPASYPDAQVCVTLVKFRDKNHMVRFTKMWAFSNLIRTDASADFDNL